MRAKCFGHQLALPIILGMSALSSSAYAGCATQQLKEYDTTTYSGWLEAQIELYAAPDIHQGFAG